MATPSIPKPKAPKMTPKMVQTGVRQANAASAYSAAAKTPRPTPKLPSQIAPAKPPPVASKAAAAKTAAYSSARQSMKGAQQRTSVARAASSAKPKAAAKAYTRQLQSMKSTPRPEGGLRVAPPTSKTGTPTVNAQTGFTTGYTRPTRAK